MKFYNRIAEISDSDRIALLLPGYTGGSGAFSSILPLLDCDILSITYPGHGENYKDFEIVGAEDWESSVEKCIEKAENLYKDILLIGYSMGGALALLHGKDYPKLLLAPAVFSKDFIPKDNPDSKPISLDAVNPSLKAMCDEEDMKVISWFLEKDNHRSQVELNKIEKKVNDMSNTFSDTYAFIGKKDPVIPYEKSRKWLTDHGIEVNVFSESTHAILYDPHYEEVVEKVKDTLLNNERLKDFMNI